jgi:TonB family protein
LLKAGAAADAESLDKRSPIVEAINRGYADIVELLAPKVSMSVVDGPVDRGVLLTQAQKGHTGMVRWLLKKGVSANADDDRMSPLAAAALGGYEATVTALLEHRARVKWADAKTGNTALLYAVSGDQAGCVRLLIDAKADLDVKNKAGLTALHVAAIADAGKCAKVLLDAGEDWTATNPLNLTALDLALLSQNKDVVVAITDHGGRINVKGADVNKLIEGVLRVDNAPLLQRAIEDGWLPSSKLEGWPALFVAGQFGARACEAVLEAAGAKRGEPGPDVVVRAQEVDTKPALMNAVIPHDPRDPNESFAAQTVTVAALVDAQGRVRFPRVLNVTDKRLVLAVLDCLPRWTFSPAKRGDQAVAVKLRLPVILPASEKRIFLMEAVDELPKPISQKPPHYPFSSRRVGEEARVVLRFVVNAEGNVEDVEVRELSSRECADAAVKAVRTWKYKPARRGGKAVSMEMNLPIIFSLED